MLIPLEMLTITERLSGHSKGRIVLLEVIRKEKLILKAQIEAVENQSEQTDRKLNPNQEERRSFLQRQWQYLELQETKQKDYRSKYAELCRGPRIPREVINRILSFIPSNNKLKFPDLPSMTRVIFIDGLLPYAVLNPPLLLPYYERKLREDWTLADIARQEIKKTVLDEISLVTSIELRVEETHTFTRDHHLLRYPHRWKKLLVRGTLRLEELFSAFRTSPSSLKELTMLDGCFQATSTVPFEFKSLETVWIHSNYLTTFFNASVQFSFLSKLTLNWHCEETGVSYTTIQELVRLLSLLTSLRDLEMLGFDYQESILSGGVPKVDCPSLRSLSLDGLGTCTISPLFSDCNIECIEVCYYQLAELEKNFPNVRKICISVSTP